ncbi:anion permease [Aquibacillus sp. 3ASR75-11]|uniref:Anion permease n=1 Tax=Terrihalobacillus insolitus TaxID=2950438 RepID=A0A9X3WR22_9BACI|nr:SLC13 family permease [Terrihalobacillus insolitus]MDC3412017.1 anion permease [Terrihalobacillus insolitus]MDC3423298.1 anion permease [Terrihalobacillus insolitus]
MKGIQKVNWIKGNQKFVLHVGFWSLFILLTLFIETTFLSDFSTEQQLTLGLLAFAVYLWIAAPLPSGATSILLLACMLLFQLVDRVEDAVVGFLSPALYFIFMLSIISHALVKVRIDRVIARLLIKISKGGPHIIVVGLPLFIFIFPILLPSAIARYKILFPLIQRLNQYYGYGEKSLFKKYCLYVIGMMNQKSTMIIFTGGGFPILASQLFRDYGVADLGWLDWFVRIAPPLWIGMLIIIFFVWQFLKWTTPNDDWHNKNPSISLPEQESTNLPPMFWIVTGSFGLMILTWIVTDQQRVPLVLPPMLLVVFFALPKIGLINNEVIRNYDWENFLLLGSSFSIGMLMESNGTAQALAGELIGIVPQDANLIFNVLAIALFVFILRFLFVVPSSAMIVIFPIVISYAELIGIPPVGLAFLVVMVIGGVMILPIHSPTTFYAFETGIFTKKEQYTIGIFSSCTVIIMAILAALYYW